MTSPAVSGPRTNATPVPYKDETDVDVNAIDGSAYTVAIVLIRAALVVMITRPVDDSTFRTNSTPCAAVGTVALAVTAFVATVVASCVSVSYPPPALVLCIMNSLIATDPAPSSDFPPAALTCSPANPKVVASVSLTRAHGEPPPGGVHAVTAPSSVVVVGAPYMFPALRSRSSDPVATGMASATTPLKVTLAEHDTCLAPTTV